MTRVRLLSAVVLLLGCASVADARDRSKEWERVRDADKQQLPRTAIELLTKIEREARREDATAEATRALLERIRFETGIEGSKPEERIRRVEAELPGAPPTMRAPLEVVLARSYWQYFQNNRYRFASRTSTAEPPGSDLTAWDLQRIYAEIDTHFTRALAADAMLKRTSVESFDFLLDRGTVPDRYRPTLYDFVIYEALAFYASGEWGGVRPADDAELPADGPLFRDRADFLAWRDVTADPTVPVARAVALYQDLLRFHAADADPSARLDADLARLRFGKNVGRGAARDSLYLAALERFANDASEHELSAMARAWRAELLFDQGRRLDAWRSARVGVDRFPQSFGGKQCANQVVRIEAKELSFATERVWSGADVTIEAAYRNVERIYFRLVSHDAIAHAVESGSWGDWLREPTLVALAAAVPAREWSEPLPPTPDYAPRTVELAAPAGIAKGTYALLASDSPRFDMKSNLVVGSIVFVSDLALVVRSGARGTIDGFVLEAGNGAPVGRATIRSWYRDRSKPQPNPDTETGPDGRFAIGGTSQIMLIAASRGADVLSSSRPFQASQMGEERPYESTLFFTDRSLYRPGQTIRFKGLCILRDAGSDRYAAIPGRDVTVALRDPNGVEVARASLRTNDYGSFAGSLVAPRDRLLGWLGISVEDGPSGETNVRVEEYKRPKFSVAISPPKDAPALGSRVVVAGAATNYTGAPVDGARVAWRVTRAVEYPIWWGWRMGPYWPTRIEPKEMARGLATTGADGSFSIEFPAEPDSSARAEGEPTFLFSVHADVTDPAGETRSDDLALRIGTTALRASLGAEEWQTPDRDVPIVVRVASLDSYPRAARGRLVVRSLIEPAVTSRRRWRPDETTRAYRRENASELAPSGDPSDPANWEEGAIVAEREAVVDTSGEMTVRVRLAVGHYRAHFETQDAGGRSVRAILPLRVIDPAATRCAFHVPDFLAARSWIVEPGEDLVMVWGSGHADARAYVEVEHRGKLIQSFWTPAGRTQVTIRQRVSEAMRGGFGVRVTMVHDNRAYLHEQRVEVPWSNKELDVRWERLVSKLEPGARETWTAVARFRGEPVRDAEMAAALYDASLDAIDRHSWQTLSHMFRRDGFRSDAAFANVLSGSSGGGGRPYAGWQHDVVRYRTFPPGLIDGGGGERITVMSAQRMLSAGGEVHVRGGRGEGLKFAAPVDGIAIETAEGAAPAMGGDDASSAIRPGAHPPAVRKNLEETAFFFPQLRADSEGRFRMEFTMPEAVTEWRFLGFVHDKKLRSGALDGRAVTSRDLMVQPNPPRFLREADSLEFVVKVTNRTKSAKRGTAVLALTDAFSGEPVDRAFGNATRERAFEIPALESRTIAWRIAVPDGAGPVVYRATATSGNKSDGEEGVLPVLSRHVFVTESIPLAIRGPGERTLDFARLRTSAGSPSLRNESLTLQMTSNPAWYAVMSLPFLMEYPHQCTEQVFNRLYASALAGHIAASDPLLRATFERWRGTSALDSPLEKNEELKSVALLETPWVRQAKSESEARRNVGVLFDVNRLEVERGRAQDRLRELQLPDGRWSWFPGCPPSDFVTLYVTTGFARLRHLGVTIDGTMAKRATESLDRWAASVRRDVLNAKPKPANPVTREIALYLYARGLMLPDRPLGDDVRPTVDWWLDQARQHWTELGSRQSQAHVALALWRFGDRGTARAIVRSLGERAVHDEEMGMSWRDPDRFTWFWERAPIETQAMMIEAFDEIAGDTTAVEDMKVWLLKQKQTQAWPSTKATADAVYALLLRGRDALASRALVAVTLGDSLVRPEAVEAGTGYYERRIAGPDVAPALARVTLAKSDKGIAWGGLHWQYFEDLSNVRASSDSPLRVTKTLLVRRTGPRGPVLEPIRGPVQVGDEIVSRIELRVDRDMEFVHLKDGHGSGLEPSNVLSGYRWADGLGRYEETRDTATNEFIEWLRRGTYVIEIPSRVQHRGRYRAGLAEVQCMYAPEFNSHSASTELIVE